MPREPTDVEPIDQVPIPVNALLWDGDSAHLCDAVHHLEIPEYGGGVHEGLRSEFGNDLVMDLLERLGVQENRIDESEQQAAAWHPRGDRGIT